MGQLRTLGLSHNHLSSVPPSLGTLHLCWQLHLDSNTLQQLPPSLAAMTALSDFSAADNQLQAAPPWLGTWTDLERLCLAGNYIGEVPPAALAPLTRLQELHLGSNLLTWLQLPCECDVGPRGAPCGCEARAPKSDRQRAVEALRKASGGGWRRRGRVGARWLAPWLVSQAQHRVVLAAYMKYTLHG